MFEVTESDQVRDRQHLRGILAFYRSAGFRVALDDVGAGYFGLNLLQDLHPDYMKMIRNVQADPFRQSIVTHLVALAHENGIRVVAEGIEAEVALAWLRSAGVDYVQGFLIARPGELASALAVTLARPVAAHAVAPVEA